jgi:toxin ParE1/3/4
VTFTVRRSRAAREDLIEVWLSIGVYDAGAADRQLDRIEAGITALSDHPWIGPARDELMIGARALLRTPFLIFYRVDEEAHCVEVIRVIDARRNLTVLLQE